MTTETNIPAGCLPFDLQQFADHGGTNGAFDVVFVRQHQSEPEWTLVKPAGKSDWHWWIDRAGKYVAWHSPESEHPVNMPDAGNVYCKPERLSELNPLVGQEVRMDPPGKGSVMPSVPQYVSFSGEVKQPEPPITATLWLDAEGKRKITVSTPLSVTKAELARIQAWIGLQLLVEGEK